METKEIGAGSYPEPSEKEEKCFVFHFDGGIYGTGYVYAKNREQAINLINSNEYEVEKQVITDFDFTGLHEE